MADIQVDTVISERRQKAKIKMKPPSPIKKLFVHITKKYIYVYITDIPKNFSPISTLVHVLYSKNKIYDYFSIFSPSFIKKEQYSFMALICLR